jgi:hypothetical protein
MRKKFFLISFTIGLVLGLLDINYVLAEEPALTQKSFNYKYSAPGSFRGAGPNLKLIPSIYWNTLGLEFEYPSGLASFGVIGMYKFNERYGNDNNFKVRPEDYQKNGYRFEVFGRYYFRGEAPVGLFVEGKVFYNTIVYFDGNTMPFTLYNRWKELDPDNINEPSEILKPSALGIGFASGVQIQVIPNVLIANLKGGIDINQDNEMNDKKLFLTIYILPSIGISF